MAIRNGKPTFTGSANLGSTSDCSRVPSAATSNGVYPYPSRVPRAKYCTYGSMPRSDISQTQRNCSPILGKNTGKIRKHASSTSSERTTSCSTASFSRQCSWLMATTISSPTMSRPTNFLTLRGIRSLPRVTGLSGFTNTSATSPANRMCCVMS